MESAAKCAIICVSRNGPICGRGFLYQFVSGITSIVMVFG